MRRLPAICLLVATVFLMGANKTDTQTETDKRKIEGKWEVVSVKRDGRPQHGEVGRARGDVISIELNDLGKLLLS